jgi:hypothetical protein
VFHKHYYDEVAQVKCSLFRSDGDSNRFLISWWFLPHINHTHPLKWVIGHQINYSGQVAGSTGTTVPRGRLTASWPYHRAHVATRYQRQYSVLWLTPGPNSFLASRSEWLILPVKHGACVQHDSRDDNDQSLTDTDGITTVQNPARLRPISIYHQHLVLFHDATFSQK